VGIFTVGIFTVGSFTVGIFTVYRCYHPASLIWEGPTLDSWGSLLQTETWE
jgi:hypothetical protein